MPTKAIKTMANVTKYELTPAIKDACHFLENLFFKMNLFLIRKYRNGRKTITNKFMILSKSGAM
jgi:hypothetical protein